LAEEGADIIAVDLCRDIDTIGYPMATPEDLDETARLIEKTSQRVVIAQADVREAAQLRTALDSGLAEFGKLDIVVAQAGITGMKGAPPLQAWCDVINTDLIGTINAIQVALPHLRQGASIIATGSTAALMDTSKKDNPGKDPAGWPTCTPNVHCRATCTTWRPSFRRPGFGPTSSIRPTQIRTCCKASRCTVRSGRTSKTQLAPTLSRFSVCSRR
jgi:NAD(P)-dependent dehydrogenase (short-subunit alcohol dehydrogenase family)